MVTENKEADPTAEVIKRFETLEGEKKKLQTDLAELQVRMERSEKSKSVSLPGSDEKPISFAKIVRGMAAGGLDNEAAWKDAGFEREVGLEARKRAMTFGSSSNGGFLVPEEQLRTMIPMLRSKTVCYEMGATDFPINGGAPVSIPLQNGGATAYWVAEGNPITDSNLTGTEVTATPHELAALTKASNRLLSISNPQAEGIIRDDLMKVMARKLDLAALRGLGSSNQPYGIKNYAGVNTKTSVGAPDFDDLNDWLYELELDNADDGKLGWVFHPRTLNGLRKLKDEHNQYYLRPDVGSAIKGTLLGFPYRTSTAIPATRTGDTDTGGSETEAYFGNWAELLIARWGGMEILASNVAGDSFVNNQTWVRIIGEFDIVLRHPESFVYASGITT